MIIEADYHTHTTFSHGKGKVIDNALSAQKMGLKELGISDHGFSHPAFGLRKKKLDDLVSQAKSATLETGVKVLVGIESNLISDSGECDLKPALYDKFDIFLMGMHQFVLYRPGTFFKLFLPDLFCNTFKCKPASWVIKENTKAFINAIKKSPIDAITHLNFKCYTDAVEVAKCASDYGTYIELNAKKEHLTDEEIYALLKTEARFIIDSDAHSPDRVGEVSLVRSVLDRINFPLDRIDNVDGRLPDFRFKKFKGQAGR